MHSFVEAIGGVGATFPERISDAARRRAERSPVRCPDAALSAAMVLAIDEAAARGDSLGGVVRVDAEGVPPGLGSHTQWDLRIEGRIAAALMALPGVKGVENGLGLRGRRAAGVAGPRRDLPRRRGGRGAGIARATAPAASRAGSPTARRSRSASR